ncbi:beta-ketoacyl-ACP synthase II [Sebaldella sp. S0638]|uniref:beta-ketoacyl-ACP synthase II n=1 Tax=Sebaldella sp. S0638 TaxID=2957809 RepID=UPI00209E83F6|nr:beta-ketoacyl-ACP synthase II [Sebaldella sp. S0638]MCP1225348.1 beta-ketoacyl-ACP synthase II [Sebaldella sp. S0638]
MKRVVVTGYGIISAIGNDIDTFWQNTAAGKSGIKLIKDPEFSDIPTRIAAYIENFDAEKYMNKKDINKTDLFTQYAYAAASQALESGGVNDDTFDKNRVGIYIGSGVGGLDTILKNHKIFLEKGSRRVSPFMVPMMITNMAAGFISINTGFKGPSFSPVSACATSNHAIGEAFLSIKHGYTDAVLAGGAESPLNPLTFAGFSNMKAMSRNNDNPLEASRPFDKDRDGFVIAEGAGILLLEEYEHAVKRGAVILGEIVGYGATSDAFHMTTPDFHGAERAMNLALSTAGVHPSSVNYINAHATSTKEGDISETNAIKSVFGENVKNLKISATKSITGHLFGAAGGAEAVITLKAIENSLVPPTINLKNPDEKCDLDYTPNTAVKHNIEYALSNGFGFGGHNASLLFKKYRG